ncbi:unnamed protein product [Clavelina lepadiformis]|uniref:Uncharacterized protein n=1 Tax=Clavelina lepadiformis TaxID=159417 RepID=A0ABP0GWL7_CLALP
MAKLPLLVNPSDIYTEDVLKCIRETIRKKGNKIRSRYDASKTASRNDHAFVTCVADEEKAWRAKFERRKSNLTHGFFAEKSKPYQSVGTVYLEAGDLVLNSITEDLKSKITRLPRHFKQQWKTSLPTRKPASQQKKIQTATPVVSHPADLGEATAGYTAIKDRINEVHEMKKGVLAEQSLCGYLMKKDNELYVIEKKVQFEMKTPARDNWKIVRSFGKILGAVKSREPADLASMMGAGGLIARVFGSSRKKTNLINNDLPEMEDKEETMQKWRVEKQQQYLTQKLQCVRSLLCALFNMKTKLLKLQNPLPHKTVKDLLRSEVTLDSNGKPVLGKTQQQPSGTEEHSNMPDGAGMPADLAADAKPLTAIPASLQRKGISNMYLGPNQLNNNNAKKPKFAQIASKIAFKTLGPPSPKVDTWEDLLGTGERNKPNLTTKTNVPVTPANKHSSKLRRRDVGPAQGASTEIATPWTTVTQVEEMINEKKRISVLGNATKRTPDDILNDIRSDFSKMQKRLSREAISELQRQRVEQFKLVQTKFHTVHLGPIPTVALEKMRVDANAKTKDRKDSFIKPQNWYVELENEVCHEPTLKEDISINTILKKVARFQYEDNKTIPFGKEKICLLVMSMPAHLLLTRGMMNAVSFVLDRILGSPSELVQHWLVARKLHHISAMLKSGRVS